MPLLTLGDEVPGVDHARIRGHLTTSHDEIAPGAVDGLQGVVAEAAGQAVAPQPGRSAREVLGDGRHRARLRDSKLGEVIKPVLRMPT
jgi:hypothetical protein